MPATSATTFCGTPMDAARSVALERLFSRISDVASLPATAQRLVELTSQETPPVDEIRQVIETDPAFLANLLRRVNSAYYGMAGRVTDARSAVSLLGVSEIRNLAMTIFLAKFTEKPSDYGTYRRSGLWTHCIAVGCAARLIAKATRTGVPDEAYVAGLLHDFGFILMDQFLPQHFRAILDEIDEHTPSPEVENRILTFDHAMLGGFVAGKWNFPQSAADAITFHHRPLDYQGPHRCTLFAVVMANWLCSELGHLSLGVAHRTRPDAEVFMGLNIDDASLAELNTALRPELEKVRGLVA